MVVVTTNYNLFFSKPVRGGHIDHYLSVRPDADFRFTEIEREFSFGSWVLQMVGVYFLPTLVIAVVEGLFGFGETPGTLMFDYLAAGLGGWALARFAAYVSDDPAQEGVMVWVLPAFFEVVFVLWSLLSSRRSEFYGFFVTFGPGRGEESLGLFMVTIPTVGCCVYSAVMRGLVKR